MPTRHHKVKDIYKQISETFIPQPQIVAEHYIIHQEAIGKAGFEKIQKTKL